MPVGKRPERRYWTTHYTNSEASQTQRLNSSTQIAQQHRRAQYDGTAPLLVSFRAAELTARELDVLLLVTAGLSNTEIAVHLGLTPSTVISYLSSIYSKLGVRSRTAAIRYAIDHHLCPASAKKVADEEERVATGTGSALNITEKVRLTRREKEVLQLVSAGLSNAEIADRLVITLATVFGYLNDIYRKLGVRSRTAAMRYAIDHSLC